MDRKNGTDLQVVCELSLLACIYPWEERKTSERASVTASVTSKKCQRSFPDPARSVWSSNLTHPTLKFVNFVSI